jgi:uncharacterized membrane protein
LPGEEHAPEPRRLFGKARLEAFSDGVFAIAITLLVLDLAIPGSGPALDRVFDAWPFYLAYVVSFLTIGAAWLAHTWITDRLTNADLPLPRLNLLLLLVVALLPFPTRLVAEGLDDVSGERVFVTMYGIALLGIRVLLYALDAYAWRERLYAPGAPASPTPCGKASCPSSWCTRPRSSSGSPCRRSRSGCTAPLRSSWSFRPVSSGACSSDVHDRQNGMAGPGPIRPCVIQLSPAWGEIKAGAWTVMGPRRTASR